MKMLIINLYIIINFIGIPHKAHSYKIYALERNGYLGKDVEPVNKKKYAKDDLWLFTHIDRFLRKHKNIHAMKKHKNINNYPKKIRSFINIVQSPVTYSHGRFTLDLDRFNVEDIESLDKEIEKQGKYIDSYENINNYNDLLGLKHTKARNKRTRQRKMHRLKSHDSFRKLNPIRTNKMYKNAIISLLKNKIRNQRAKNFYKRFRIVKNNGKTNDKRNSIDNNSWKTSEENVKFNNTFYNDSFESIKKLKKKKDRSREFSSDESYEEDDMYYLQANILLKPNNIKNKFSNDENIDRRRRLPYFLPKRYHWESDELQDLGYFWFNGPKGRYPFPKSID